MKLSNIKTRSQLEAVGEIYYQRVHNLRIIWQDECYTDDYRARAYALFAICLKKVLGVSQILMQLNQPKPMVGEYSKRVKE